MKLHHTIFLFIIQYFLLNTSIYGIDIPVISVWDTNSFCDGGSVILSENTTDSPTYKWQKNRINSYQPLQSVLWKSLIDSFFNNTDGLQSTTPVRREPIQYTIENAYSRKIFGLSNKNIMALYPTVAFCYVCKWVF